MFVFPFSSEMSIIDEYERNLQFEQQYILSVVEGMDEMHVICPVCRAWVKYLPVIIHVSTVNSFLHYSRWQLNLKCFFVSFFFFRNNVNINSHFISCPCGLYVNTKVCLSEY